MAKVIFVIILITYSGGFAQPQSKKMYESTKWQTEISIAINPTNPQNLIASWNGEMIELGINKPKSGNEPNDLLGAFQQPAFYSKDAGNNWFAVNGDYGPNNITSRGDPVVFFNIYGEAFYVTMGADMNTSSGGIFILKSLDGGMTYGSTVNADPLAELNDDKPHATADLSGIYADNVYVAWTDFNTNQIILTRSTNRGESFGQRKDLFHNFNEILLVPCHICNVA